MPCLEQSRARTSFALALIAVAVSCAADGDTDKTAARHQAPPPLEAAAEQLLERSRALIREERFDEARALLEPEVAARPAWADGRVGLALTYIKEERWESARLLLEEALALDPGLDRARLPLGWCLYYLGRLEPARSTVEAFLEKEPDYADAVYALSLIELEGEDLERAESLLRRVIMLGRAARDRERQALAHTRLADLYLRRGSASRARIELERSLKLTPDDALVHFKMSRVLQLLGDDAGAAAAREAHRRLQQAAP
jgi:tetratricopeptide (TPR) repeat protein